MRHEADTQASVFQVLKCKELESDICFAFWLNREILGEELHISLSGFLVEPWHCKQNRREGIGTLVSLGHHA